MAVRVVIALGSNIGDRLAHLQQARDRLQTLAVRNSFLQSAVYQTEPVLCPESSPDFFNAVVSFDYVGSASQLHQQTRSIESALGRQERKQRNAPRVIDLDLLLFGEQTISLPELLIPHPRLHMRRFVLEPLCEIHADLKIPGHSLAVHEQLSLLQSREPALLWVTSNW